MPLPLQPPLLPQLARSAAELPEGEGWLYEPKLDGFRAIAFVDGDESYVQSRNGKPLGRYFPELRFPAGRYVLDGELVIRAEAGGEDFEGLQERIHPAASRVARLAAERPATFVAFDLLARDDRSLLDAPLTERRAALEAVAADPVELIPSTALLAEAAPWLETAEGVIAKRAEAAYRPGERVGMVKVKRVRTIDCAVVGWRPGKAEGTVGSLILGLYAPSGELYVVGHTSGLHRRTRARARRRRHPARDRRARRVGAQPLERRSRPRVARAAPRPRRRGQLRSQERPPHPPRRAPAALPRRQGRARLRPRTARHLTGAQTPLTDAS